ncbi:GH32 C-terminal domain-containing protein [Paenibacillus sp. JNUCC31]|uniref:GH32 C-terminal domain-containing protein n=1 Tax=Paenibacillus sp. JNUCC-31 TaxID=2777983 RepID=UPI002B1F92FF|nr:GH32 C-terminal domain-containing protein [Paenibacillus sp. JNUCC-31]
MKFISGFIGCVLLLSVLGSASVGAYSIHSDEGREMPMGAKGTSETNETTVEQPEEGADILSDVSKAVTNLSGWRMEGKGSLEDTDEGIRLTSDAGENAIAISATRADNFIYEADLMIQDMKADTSLVFRSNDTGWASYMLQVIPQAGVIRLKDASGQPGTLNVEHKVSLDSGGIYHLKVKANGESLQVYWDNRYDPVIDVKDGAYSSGNLGLHVWDGAALFQNVQVSAMNGNMGKPMSSIGEWQPDLKGYKGNGNAQGKGRVIYEKAASDFVYEGNISLANTSTSAGLLFRASPDGARGYEAALIREGEEVRVQLRKADGTVLASSDRTYPSQPGAKHHVEVIASVDLIQVYMDGYSPAAVEVTDTSYASGHAGFVVQQGTAYFQDTYITEESAYYKENYRPQYHYSPIRGSASDPNGLIYYEGEYHLFHQDGGTWAHAVSSDLINWKRLPIALPWNDQGHVWSGSAIADLNNASGLFSDSGGKGLIAYYTSHHPDKPGGNQRIGLAYSTDQGRNWKYAEDRPIVIDNPGKKGDDPGSWDFRDPKVVRDEDNNRWIMVVSGGDHIRFFTSTNLLDWTLTDNFGYGDYVRGGVWECPDLIQLPVDGTGQRKWVLMISTGANPKTQGSDAEYFVGQLTADGKFLNDYPAGQVLRTDFGKEFYASMSFANMPDQRKVMLAWMTNWDYPFEFPTSSWKGQLTIPREVSLRTTDEGVRLVQTPITELQTLRHDLYSAQQMLVGPKSKNMLDGLTAGAYEIEAEVEIPANSPVTEFGFQLRKREGQKTTVGYSVNKQNLFVDRTTSGDVSFSDLFTKVHEAPLQPENQKVKLRIFVDESSVEVFGNDGKVVFSDVIFPDPAGRAMSFYSLGGEVKVSSMKVHALDNIWRKSTSSRTQVIADVQRRMANIGQTQTLYATVEGGLGKGVQPLKWKVSDPKVVQIVHSGKTQATVRAVGGGEAVVTVSTANGKASAKIPITVSSGTFHTNLSGWKSDQSSAQWLVSKQGIQGSHNGDSQYIAKETAGDFQYDADLTLGAQGGAGSIVFRASEDGRSGYYLNIDPNLKAIRLFYKVNGKIENRQVLAQIPRFIRKDQTYHIRIQTDGPRIQVEVNGERIMDLQDGTFAEGHFGIHVFGGSVSFQNVNAIHTKKADLEQVIIRNTGRSIALQAVPSEAGEVIKVAENTENASEGFKWVLVPTGDDSGSYSIRTLSGMSLDWDVGQNRIQLYSYLGYANQRWNISKNEDGTMRITNAHNGHALGISEDGSELVMGELRQENKYQKWVFKQQ